VLQRLVLQRALAALVALRAVQRVVDEQELELALLVLPATSLVRWVRTTMSSVHGGRAGGERACAAPRPRPCTAAGADRVEQRVVAERGMVMPELLGGADHERALRDLISCPSIVSVTGQTSNALLGRPTPTIMRRAVALGVVGDGPACGVDVVGQAAVLDQVLVLVAEVLEPRTPGSSRRRRARRTPGRRSGRRLVSACRCPPAAAAGEDALEHLGRARTCPPGTGCTCRTTRARRSASS
jgi:hypothetical protein